MIGGHHNMRNFAKGHSIRTVENHCPRCPDPAPLTSPDLLCSSKCTPASVHCSTACVYLRSDQVFKTPSSQLLLLWASPSTQLLPLEISQASLLPIAPPHPACPNLRVLTAPFLENSPVSSLPPPSATTFIWVQQGSL